MDPIPPQSTRFEPPEPPLPRALRAPLLRALTRRALARAGGHGAAAAEIDALGRAFEALRPRMRASVPRLLESSGLGALVAADVRPFLDRPGREAVDDLALRTFSRGRRLAAERHALARALAAEGLPFSPLKGAWLAERLYPEPSARPMADTDLFVDPANAAATARVLRALGYLLVARTWKHEVWQRPGEDRVVDPRGEHPDNPRPLELHPRIGESFRGIDLWLASADERSRGAHLLAHATVDMLSRRLRPITLVDLGLWIAAAPPGAWDRLHALARRKGAARFLWPALALAERELGSTVPTAVRHGLRSAVRPALRAWSARVDLDAVGRDARAEVGRALFEIHAIWPESAVERARVLRAQLLPMRWQLADRDPALAASCRWPLALVRHWGGLPALARRRWRRRQR